MKMNKDLVSRLEALARIELPPDSALRIASQLETIVSYIDRLAEVDTAGVQPAHIAFPRDDSGFLRRDEVRSGMSRRQALEPAPGASEDFFRVPRVIDGEEGR